MRLALAFLHLVALGIGLGAVWVRAVSLRARPLTREAVRRALAADAAWGIAALLWLATGLWRLLGATEKSTVYYMRNAAFHAKIGLFLLILLLELWPMITLVRWRSAMARAEKGGSGWSADETAARRIGAISLAQGVLVLGMVLAANMMARGYGSFGPRDGASP